MRIAIFGTGGAGGYFGAHLAQGGADVAFVARGEHLEAIRRDGLRVATPDGEIVTDGTLATDDPAAVGTVDVVILGVKAGQVAGAAEAMRPMIGTGTFVVPLQNGVEAPAELARVLGGDYVLGGLCGTLSRITGPGRIESIGDINFIKFGELDGRRSARAQRLLEAFDRAGVQAEVPGDIQRALWEKFLFVVSFGGVGSVTRATIGEIRGCNETRQMLRRCMEEILAVGQARQIALDDGVVDRTMAFVDTIAPGGTTSLQRDIADGKPSELEYWNGAVVRLGRESGVETPLHEFIYHSLLLQEAGARAG